MDRFLLFRTFDELVVGDRQSTRGRTITETDIVNWCSLTGDWYYPHVDKVAAERSMFGQRVAPGIMVFAIGTGLGVPADSTTILANYGTDQLRYPKATWIGDTIHLEIELLEKEERDAEDRTRHVPVGRAQPERRDRLREPPEDPDRPDPPPL